jgi:hypothetical protein
MHEVDVGQSGQVRLQQGLEVGRIDTGVFPQSRTNRLSRRGGDGLPPMTTGSRRQVGSGTARRNLPEGGSAGAGRFDPSGTRPRASRAHELGLNAILRQGRFSQPERSGRSDDPGLLSG